MKASETTVQRANIACPSCGQTIDFSLSKPVKDAAPAPVLTEEECDAYSGLYKIAVVVSGDQPTAHEIAQRAVDAGYRLTKQAPVLTEGQRDFVEWARVHGGNTATRLVSLIDRLTKQAPQPETHSGLGEDHDRDISEMMVSGRPQPEENV